MNVVLDDNVLVSAIISPHGAPSAIVGAWRRGEFNLVTSAALIGELARVLSYPSIRKRTGWAPNDEAAFIELLWVASIVVAPDVEVVVSRDPTDNRVLEAALAGSADYIVSGDNDLLVLVQFEQIPIIRPVDFLTVLTSAT